MFLKEFSIRRYGPLPDSGRIRPGRFNLVYGPNEDGKTMTIDALLRLLFDKEALNCFREAKRVAENPDGYLVIENGKERKLPEEGTLSDLYDLNAREFSRIFVIRDSDLSINRESDFYRDMTARLTGMRTGEIRSIVTKIQEMGRLTPKKALQNTEPFKFKERLAGAEELLEMAELLQRRLGQEGFSTLEENLARLTHDGAVLNEQLELYRAAYRRDLYRRGRKILDDLAKVRSEAAEHAAYSKEDYQAWQKAESALGHYKDERVKLEEQLEAVQQDLHLSRGNMKDLSVRLKRLEQEKETAEERIKPLITQYDTARIQLKKKEALSGGQFFTPALIVSVALLFLSLAGTIFSPSWWLFVILVFSVLLTGGGGVYLFLQQLGRSKQGALAEEIRLKAANLGLPADSTEAVRSSLAMLDRDYSRTAQQYKEAEKEVDWLERENLRINEALDQNRKRAIQENDKITAVKKTTAVENLDAFAELLERKESLASEIKTLQSLLQSHFASTGDRAIQGDPDYSVWEEKVEKYAPYQDAAPGLSYDRSAVDQIRDKLTELEQHGEQLRTKQDEYRRELHDIENNYNQIMQYEGEGHLPCQTMADLEKTVEKLKRWIENQELNVAAARHTLSLLEEMEMEEEEKVSELFGPDSPVSSYFEKATGGRYRAVHFQGGDLPLRVVDSNGTSYDADALSGGAYDQLYFSIRLALGGRLLEGEKGFFILDDPFIKADPERLRTMLQMLHDICSDGWQIFYFSSKGEIKEALDHDLKAGLINEIRVGLSNK